MVSQEDSINISPTESSTGTPTTQQQQQQQHQHQHQPPSKPPKKTILIINGPNLNLLGHREPSIYGHTTLDSLTTHLQTLASAHDIHLQHFQSNHEGLILDRIHSCLLGREKVSPVHFTSTPSRTHHPHHQQHQNQQKENEQEEEKDEEKPSAIIINPGALTHQSIALRDALLGISTPFVEVHISNVHAREPFRHKSYLSDKAEAVICGLGVYGYESAVRYWIWKWGAGTKERDR